MMTSYLLLEEIGLAIILGQKQCFIYGENIFLIVYFVINHPRPSSKLFLGQMWLASSQLQKEWA